MLVRQDDDDENTETLSIASTLVDVEEAEHIISITTMVEWPAEKSLFCRREDGFVSVDDTKDGKEMQRLYTHSVGCSIVAMEFGASNNMFLTADITSRSWYTKFFGGTLERYCDWKIEGPTADFHLEQPVFQLILLTTPARTFISLAGCDMLYTLEGDSIRSTPCPSRRLWRWVSHSTSEEKLVLLQDHSSHNFSWDSLTRISEPNRLVLCDSIPIDVGIKSLCSYCNGLFFCAEFS